MAEAIKNIDIIPSKSFAHRAYICDFLAGQSGSGVLCSFDSDDINATRDCIEGLKYGEEIIDVGESGSTLRFILPLVGALGQTVSVVTHGRLSERPMGPFEAELEAHGMEINHIEDGVIDISGDLMPGVFRLPGSISSQYITGLLLSLPALSGDSRIELTSELQSGAYVDITLSVLADYGIKVDEHDGTYYIPGGQKYHTDKQYEVEGDWSQAAFWIVAGVIGKTPVRVNGLKADSVQGDRKIVEILRGMGGDIRQDKAGITAFPSVLKGGDIDVSETPDLAPVIAVAAVSAVGESHLTGAKRLKFKESDRIQSIVNCLKSLGFDAEGTEDEIVIDGKGSGNTGGTAATASDHRIVMMAAVLSLITDGKVYVEDSSAVAKSYPTFFDEMERAGFADNMERI